MSNREGSHVFLLFAGQGITGTKRRFPTMVGATAAALISAVISLISLVLSFLANDRQRRSDANEMYRMLMDKWLSDEDIYKFVNMVEYEEFKYVEGFHEANSEVERVADKTLMFFNQICYLKRNGSLPVEHMGSFNYQIEGILRDDNVKDYLYNIHHYTKKENKDNPFSELCKYAKDNGLFNEQFDDEDLWRRDEKYHNYLHF